MAGVGARSATCFIYGCGSALLFLPLFLVMGRFGLWLEYQAPPTPVIVVTWILLMLLLGGLCSFIWMVIHTEEEHPSQTHLKSLEDTPE